jgi:hypothetical protein
MKALSKVVSMVSNKYKVRSIFCFYFIKSQSQKLDSIILVYFHFKFAKLKMNIFLLLLREWLHWKFNYT